MVKKLFFQWPNILFWLVIYYPIFQTVIWPFWFQNNLDLWDTSAHHQAIWFVKTYLFPAYTGWNPFAFSGFPQGLLYPPFFHYLGACLANFFSIAMVLKFLVIVPILFFPVTIYFFVRSFGITKKEEIFFLVTGYLFFNFLLGDMVGGSFGSTFTNGVVINNFSLILFFWLLFFLKKQKLFGSVMLFSLIILTHLPTAVAAGIATLTFLVAEKPKKFYFLTLSLTFLITCFWTIPFLFFCSEMSMTFLGGLTPEEAKLYLFLGIWLWLTNSASRWRFQTILGIFLAIFVVALFSLQYQFPSWHVYRLTSFAVWLLPFLIFFLLESMGVLINTKTLILEIIIFLYVGIYVVKQPISYFQWDLKLPKFSPGERIITNYKVDFLPGSPHFLNDRIPIISKNTPATGLFMEESANSPYLLLSQYNLSSKNFMWGLQPASFMKRAERKLDIEKVFKLFNITRVLSVVQADADFAPNSTVIGEFPNPQKEIGGADHLLVLQTLGKNSLVEPIFDLTFTGQIDLASWKEKSWDWFLNQPLTGLLVQSESFNYSKKLQVPRLSNLKLNANESKLRFKINSSVEVPVLIKISFFPKWHAWADGKEIPVLRASPNLMLIKAKGNVILRYEDFPWEKNLRLFSLLISILFFIMTLYDSYIKRLENCDAATDRRKHK